MFFTIFMGMVRASMVDDFQMHFGFELSQIIFMGIAVYGNLLILIPRYLEKKHYGRYAGFLFLLLLTNAVVYSLAMNYFPELKPPFARPNRPHFHWAVPIGMMQFMLIAVSSALHFLRENYILREEALNHQARESSQLQAELDSLKSQINPHFLFNSLNNIYSHSLLESEKTPGLILKLSGLLNYILYECQDERVTLDKELEFLKNYLELEQVRIDESVSVKLDVAVDDPALLIAPLLFVPLIENAFKHGVNIQRPNPYIHVKLSTNHDGIFNFSCKNLKDEFHDTDTRSGGIGLSNVRKRLELIYPGQHEFKIFEDNDSYEVNLILKLGE